MYNKIINKEMKKQLLTLAVLVMSMAAFVACSKEDDEPVLATITTDASVENLTIVFGESFRIAPSYTDVDDATTYEWTVNNEVVGKDSVLVYTPQSEGVYDITLKVTNAAGTVQKKFKVTVVENLQTVTFEGDYWNALIDDKQYEGSLLYGENATSYAWTDETTKLSGGLTLAWGGLYGFAEGGTAISNYIDSNIQEHNDYIYQLAVPESNGSKNFAVVYCDAYIHFPEGEKHIIKSMDISPTTYQLGITKFGKDNAAALTNEGSYLTIVVSAYEMKKNQDDKLVPVAVGTPLNIDLARDGNIVETWKKIDFSSLGEVYGLKFTMIGSDATEWGGIHTPTYFAFDNVVVKM